MKSKDLDTKIRDVAIKELSKKVLSASYSLLNLMGCTGNSNKVKIKTTSGDMVEVYDKSSINEFIKASIQRQSDRVGEIAVNEFIKKVEGLQNEIDNIYENIN